MATDFIITEHKHTVLSGAVEDVLDGLSTSMCSNPRSSKQEINTQGKGEVSASARTEVGC